MDIYISAAAISDFRVKDVNDGKISSDEDITIELIRLPKLLKEIKVINPNTIVVAFKAEAGVSEEVLIKKSRDRMKRYEADLMVANDILVDKSGPGSDNNEVYLIDSDSYEKIVLDTKSNISKKIVEKICSIV